MKYSDGSAGGRSRNDSAVLKKLLGSLELQVMTVMWRIGEATVREVADDLRRKRAVAYTTVMTVMGHLTEKGLLTRAMEQKRYRYRVALDRNKFLQDTSRKMVRDLLQDFGDVAAAGFIGEIGKIDPEKLDQLHRLAQEADDSHDQA